MTSCFRPTISWWQPETADQQTQIWSVGDGRLLHTIPDAGFVAFSADGALLAATKDDDTNIRL